MHLGDGSLCVFVSALARAGLVSLLLTAWLPSNMFDLSVTSHRSKIIYPVISKSPFAMASPQNHSALSSSSQVSQCSMHFRFECTFASHLHVVCSDSECSVPSMCVACCQTPTCLHWHWLWFMQCKRSVFCSLRDHHLCVSVSLSWSVLCSCLCRSAYVFCCLVT